MGGAARIACLTALAATFLASSVSTARTPRSTSAGASWVFFRDHGSSPEIAPLREAAPPLSHRALARRARVARARARSGGPIAKPEAVDRDLHAPYLAAIAKSGGVLRARSRWLNAVSVEAGPAALDAIRALPFVADVRPVAPIAGTRAAGVDEFTYGTAFHQVDLLGIPEAHAMGYRGEGVLIAVLDSGFDLRHEAFDGIIVRAERDFLHHDDFTGYDPRHDLPNQPNHGTAVLSLIGGYAPERLIGPAYRAEYLLAKVESIALEKRVEEDAWCEALEWAEAMGADLVTSSITFDRWYQMPDRDGRTAVITRAANAAFDRGLMVVNSIGNDGPIPYVLSPPSDAPGVLSVGSTDWNGELSAFSSYGPSWDGRVKPDLVAMGSGVWTAIARTRDGYEAGSGTSYATPLVAGCAALVMEAHPDWSPEAVRDALLMSADRAARPDPRMGWGLPSARDAILYPLLEGIVTDAHTGEPIAGATVRWSREGDLDSSRAAPSDGPASGEARTDATGAYRIPNLPDGTYRVRVEAPGYFESVTEPLEVPPGLGDVNVALRYRGE